MNTFSHELELLESLWKNSQHWLKIEQSEKFENITKCKNPSNLKLRWSTTKKQINRPVIVEIARKIRIGSHRSMQNLMYAQLQDKIYNFPILFSKFFKWFFLWDNDRLVIFRINQSTMQK